MRKRILKTLNKWVMWFCSCSMKAFWKQREPEGKRRMQAGQQVAVVFRGSSFSPPYAPYYVSSPLYTWCQNRTKNTIKCNWPAQDVLSSLIIVDITLWSWLCEMTIAFGNMSLCCFIWSYYQHTLWGHVLMYCVQTLFPHLIFTHSVLATKVQVFPWNVILLELPI